MIALEFFSWWYGAGWAGTVAKSTKRLKAVGEAFSVDTLLSTLFAPWRRIITYAGAGLDAHMRAFVDNTVSRFIGFLIRLVALLAAFVMFIVVGTAAVVEIILWPLLPILMPTLIIWGLL